MRTSSSATATIARPLRVLIVESQSDDATALARSLARYGHETFTVGSGATAIETYVDAELILLDLELPDIDGLEVCARIRAASDTPIIAFTGGQLDRVLGLQAGADDCLDKPYGFRELLARIDAVMRRSRIGVVGRSALPGTGASTAPRNGAGGAGPARPLPNGSHDHGPNASAAKPGVDEHVLRHGLPGPRESVESWHGPMPPARKHPEPTGDPAGDAGVARNGANGPKEGTLTIGSLTIDTAFRQVRVRGKTVELTRKEFDLLHYLATNSDTVITRRRLMAEVWGDQSPHAASAQASRTIDTHVSSLRGKLGEGGWIRTVRGVGFRFDNGR
ncbi:response regulator transcription factor [Labedaea rhizosphaerae]|nr:response regulator transcription factor [Labedaea rhizosphaerae]